MKFLSSLSIRGKLLFLIIVAVLPALGIILFSGIERRNSEVASAKQDILHLVQSLAALQAQRAASLKQLLQTLAQLPEVQEIDATACNRIFRNIQEQNPIYSTIAAATPDGNMFAASSPFTPGSVNLADRKHIMDAIRTRDFSAGEYIVGKVSRVPSINFTYPVLDKNGNLIAIVIAGLKLDKYKEFMTQVNLPEGSVMGIVDHKSESLYRFPEHKDVPPGTPIPVKNLRGIPVGSKEGFYEGIGIDNVSRIYAYKMLRLRDKEPLYMGIYVGVDKNVILHHANIQLAYNLCFLGIASLFAMLLAWIAGNTTIVEPLHKLVIATQRFGKGELHVRTDLPHREDELGRLATSFNTMAGMLEMNDLERRKAEEEIKRQAGLISSLLDSIPDIIFFKDINGVYLGCNLPFAEFVGKARNDIVGRTDYDLFDKGVADFFRGHDQLMLELGESRHNEEWITYPDGRKILIDTLKTPYRGPDETMIGILGISRDITLQKRDEAALRESEETIRLLLDCAAEAIYGIDMNGNCTFCNKTCLRLLGYKCPDELLGKNMHWQIHSKRPDGTPFPVEECRIYQAFHDGKGTHVDDEVLWRSDETSFPAEYWSFPLLRDGAVVGAVVTFFDITERKKAEADLRNTNRELEAATVRANEMAAQAEAANAAKSEFLANMSHEIRTPMNGVIGMTGLLLDTELNVEQRRYAETVRASGESLLGLINDILDFSKIEAGKLEMETMDFDLRALLDDFAAMLAMRAHDKGLEFICAAAPDVPTYLRGDPGRLRQVLINLTGNAVKFTHAGEIAVRASLVSETDDEAVIRFSIKDTGIGIPEEKQELLFQKFTQADASTTRQYGGTGLGLTISKRLAGMMGGEIGVISPAPVSAAWGGLAGSPQDSLRTGDEGQGSEFWFTARFAKQAERERDVVPPADIRGLHILIVDDNATNREVLMSQFAAWGVRAEETPDGPTALKALCLARDAGDPFRIAILDMQMPDMDGAELARIIKADEALKETRLVLLSSQVQRGDARHMEELGFAAYLTKPAQHSELFDCLSAVLTGTSVATQARPIVTRHTFRELRRGAFRILLAEDNFTNQQVALGILKKMGLRADAVANGAEAVKALETIPYDLVLMDVQMPVMDGLEATRIIRNPLSFPPASSLSSSLLPLQRGDFIDNRNIPIIAMTANAMQGDREKCLEAGMNDYVPKPVSPQALAEALDKWLPQDTAARKDKMPAKAEDHAAGKIDRRESGKSDRHVSGDDEGRAHGSTVGSSLKPYTTSSEAGTPSEAEVIAPSEAEAGAPSTAGDPDTPVFDKEGMMARLMDDEDLARTVIEGFLDDIPRQIVALRGYLETGDAASAERQFHTIKGAAANLGGEALRAVAFEMEKAAKAGDLSNIMAHLPELESQFFLLREAMREYTNKSLI